MVKAFPESTFTPARPGCKHPELWHAIDEYTPEVEVIELVAATVTALRPAFVVETGAGSGRVSQAIGSALARAGRGRLVAVEIKPELAEEASSRCSLLPVEVICGSSFDYRPDATVDLCWLGASVQAYARYLPFMHTGTVVGFPRSRRPGAMPAIDLFVEHGLLTPPLYLPTPRGVGFAMPTPKALECHGRV